MKECIEKIVRVGFKRNPKIVFDEVEVVTAEMLRDGWVLKDTIIEEGLAKIHLLFEREIHTIKHSPGNEPKHQMHEYHSLQM